MYDYFKQEQDLHIPPMQGCGPLEDLDDEDDMDEDDETPEE